MILNTIGAAVGSVLLFDVPEGAAFFVEMVVVARGTNGAAALFRKSALIKRLVAQAPALVGMVATTTNNHGTGSAEAPAAIVTVHIISPRFCRRSGTHIPERST